MEGKSIMKKIVLILSSGTNSRIKDICFDRPKCLLSVCGQTLIRRVINQFWDYADDFYIASGNNTEKIKQEIPELSNIHFLKFEGKELSNNGQTLKYSLDHIEENENEEYSLIILESDIVVTDEVIKRFINSKNILKFISVNKDINNNDDAIVRTETGYRFTKERNDNWYLLGKFIGITELSNNIVKKMIYDIEIPEHYV